MERRAFGRTGIDVPVIGMGTWKTFDVKSEREERERSTIVDAALASGANFLDSSPMYGEAERVLGKALEGRRDKAFVATKVWTRNGQYDPDQQIDKALDYFGGFIDLYQVHNLNDTDLVLGKREKLRQDGKTKLLGVTHYLEEHFAEIAKWMRSGRIDSVQIPYNAARTTAAEALLPLAPRTWSGCRRDGAARIRVACQAAGHGGRSCAIHRIRLPYMGASAAKVGDLGHTRPRRDSRYVAR